MELKKYIITILLNDWASTVKLTTENIDLIQLYNIMSSLDEIGDIQAVIEYETS